MTGTKTTTDAHAHHARITPHDAKLADYINRHSNNMREALFRAVLSVTRLELSNTLIYHSHLNSQQ